MKIKNITMLAVATLFATACNMEEGEGGTATLQGYVYEVNHDDDRYDLSADTIRSAKTDVFVVYGDNQYFGDDCETGEDGFYQFKFLTPGDYTIFAYSTLATGERVAEKQRVTIKRGETLDVDNIYIHQGKAYGTSMLRGWVRATYFDKNGDNGTGWAYEQRVYIQRMGESYYFDDTRVGLDGQFYFQKLQPDTYVVYTFGENNDEIPYPVYDTIEIPDTPGIYDADTLKIRLKS